MPDHEELESSVAALALGALEPGEEEAEIRAHLQACTACRELHSRLARAVEALPAAVEEVRPPDRLRASILAAAGESRRPDAAPAGQVLPLRRPARPVRPVRRPEPAARWRPRFPVNGWAGAAAALVIALGGLGAWNVNLNQQIQDSSPVHYQLHGTGAMSGVSAQVTYFRRDGFGLVDFRDMPQPAAGTVYEMWTMDAAGHPAPAGVFRPDGSGSYVLPLTRPLNGVKTLAVTIEQGPSGSPVPTQQSQLAGQVA